MSLVRRATFRFPANEEESLNIPLQNLFTEQELAQFPPVNEQTLSDNTVRVFSTDFPLIFDTTLFVTRPPISNEELETVGLKTNGRYSSNQYFIGLALNDVVVHDGVFKKIKGVLATFTSDNKGKQKGLIFVDTRFVNLGISDDIKIAIIKANTYSPWLYYGAIPERAALANNDNKFIASQGAIYPLEESELLQAVGIRKFVDVFRSQLGAGLGFIIPSFVSPALQVSVGGASSSLSDLFFMGDVLDGDGSLGYRSYTTFKVLEVQSTTTSAGIGTVANFSILRADAYRSIDSSNLDYQTNTFKKSSVVQETNLYYILDKKESLQSYYSGIGTTFNLVADFIDFETTNISIDNSSLSNNSEIIKTSFTNASTSSPSTLGTASDVNRLADIIRSSESPETKNITSLIITDLSSELTNSSDQGNLQEAITKYNSIPEETPNIVVPVLKAAIVITNSQQRSETLELANTLFGETNVTEVSFSTIGELGWLQFLGLTATAVGGTLTEDSLVLTEPTVNYNTIKENMLAMTATAGSGTDIDGDGVFSTIDQRLYELTLRYNPTRTFAPTSFLSDPPSEMRLWRKLCPIGQLFNFKGTVLASSKQRGGNLLLDVDISWPNDPDTGDPVDGKPDINIIQVYVEYGASTNLTELSGEIEFQGRLFFPGYIINTRLNSIIRFNNPGEISAWFRVFDSTARDILDFGRSKPEEPLLIIRSNYVPTSNVSLADNDDPIGISPIFGSGADDGPVSLYQVVQGPEEVNDYLLKDDVGITDPVQIGIGQQEIILDLGDFNILFNDIEFDVIIPADSVPPAPTNLENEGLIAEFEYELLYQPPGSTTPDSILDQFYSVIAFDGNVFPSDDPDEPGDLVFRFKTKPNNIKNLICKLAPEDFIERIDENGNLIQESQNKTFNITYPYIQNRDERDFVWTWNENEWEFTIRKNNIDLNDSDFETLPNPLNGQFTLVNPINSDTEDGDVITAEFKNISGGQRRIKTGSKLAIRGKSGPVGQGLDRPKFANVQINFTTNTSIERVEGHYSSTLQGDSFYLMTPANGLVALSSHGWFFTTEEGTAGAGGVGGTRITGDLTGPVLFFDAFTDSTDKRVISKTPNVPTAFPTVDIVFSNATNTFGIPFIETLSILFVPPPPPDIERITSTRSPVTERLTIVFSGQNGLQQKYSFTNFADRDTEDGWDFINKSLRRQIPIYSETLSVSELEFTVDNNEIVFDVVNTEEVPVTNENEEQATQSGDKILVAIGLEFEGKGNDIGDLLTYTLQSGVGEEFSDFGYTNGQGEVSAQIVIAPGDKTFFQIPDSTGIDKIKLIPQEENTIPPTKVIGAYVDGFSDFLSPSVFETSFGEYVLFFVVDNQIFDLRQIAALISRQDAQTWQRPGTRPTKLQTVELENFDPETGSQTLTFEAVDERFENPISILTGYSNPIVLKHNSRDVFYLFAFNHRIVNGRIDMVELNRALFNKISDDNSGTASDIDAETPDESQTSLVNTEEVTSYARVFKDGNNIKNTNITRITSIFSVEITDAGDMYLAVVDNAGRLVIKYNRSFGGGAIDTTFNWEDLRIDLLDTQTENGDGTQGSKLGKIISNEGIGALTLSYSEVDEILYLFIATTEASSSPSKLLLTKLPEALIRPNPLRTSPNDGQTHQFSGNQTIGVDFTDNEINEFYQIEYNKLTPVLVYGTIEGLDSNFVDIRSSTTEDFSPQIISVEWLSNGDGQIYFLQDGRVRSRLTKTSGDFWETFTNV